MGHGTYSTTNFAFRSKNESRDTLTTGQLFVNHVIHKDMDPIAIAVASPDLHMMRECRDSKDHPHALPIIVGLDVTGSMLNVPAQFIRKGMDTLVSGLIQKGVEDPAILFCGIGDHECDKFPLQVGQFESSDELIEHWLKNVHLEAGGGGNEGESYLLAWYFAANHTKTDHWENRKKKGFLFTIGDEPCLNIIGARDLKNLFKAEQTSNMTSKEILEKAQQFYHVFHIHLMETNSGKRPNTLDKWQSLLGNNLLIAQHHAEIPALIYQAVISTMEPVEVEDKPISASATGTTEFEVEVL